MKNQFLSTAVITGCLVAGLAFAGDGLLPSQRTREARKLAADL